MNKHKLFTVIVTAAAAASLTVLLLAVGAQAHRSGADSLQLTVVATKLSTVDVPPLITNKHSPETPGDEVIAISKVNGAASGHRYLTCAVTKTAPSIEKALYACQVTYTLSHGTITAAGVVHLSGAATAAITGGTGAYTGARGVLHSRPGTDTLSLR
ncbi:MAG TPA: hypothetical protein VFA19_07365 [Gaiellaceae bacterium]|nr:hypothetical protein [Gaiellaceae bacterium]